LALINYRATRLDGNMMEITAEAMKASKVDGCEKRLNKAARELRQT
jgi:hypothetical protein